VTSTDEMAAALELQAGFCEVLGSPFTARVLRLLRVDVVANGEIADLVASFGEEPKAAALALRVAGAFHARALDDPEGVLGEHYPTCGGDGGRGLSDEAFRAILIDDLRANRAHYDGYLESPPQTNEVGRSAVMVGGYLTIAGETGLPLDVCEIGASAGLNLGFDQFFYQLGASRFGDSSSPVHLTPEWRGATPPVSAPLVVRQRCGCDIAPLDITLPETQQRLRSYVWADQLDRMARLKGAVSVAQSLGIKIVRESAEHFVAGVLQDRKPGAVLVIAHTIMWHYMPTAMQEEIEKAIVRAGALASSDAPVAWLRLEPDTPVESPLLRLMLWAGGADDGQARTLAEAHPHGASVKWL